MRDNCRPPSRQNHASVGTTDLEGPADDGRRGAGGEGNAASAALNVQSSSGEKWEDARGGALVPALLRSRMVPAVDETGLDEFTALLSQAGYRVLGVVDLSVYETQEIGAER